MTLDQLQQQFLSRPESQGLFPGTPEFEDAFNGYYGKLANEAGVADFTQIPDNVITGGGANANPFTQSGFNETIAGAANQALLTGARGAQAGGNTQQVQGSAQSGNFTTTGEQTTGQKTGSAQSTTGTTAGTSQGTTANQLTGQTTGTSNTFGSNMGKSTGFSDVVNSNTGQTNTAGQTTGLETSTGRTGLDTNVTNTGRTENTGVNQNVTNSGSSGTSVNNTTGTSVLDTGNTFTGATTGGTAQAGQATTKVDDSLGFGGLLQGAAGAAGADDSTRRGFFTDLINTGGDQFQGQVARATGRALSGPGMAGVGDNARSRAVGSAVSQVAAENLNSRIAAANSLAGPSALTTLSGAANPYLGGTTTTAGTGTNYGTSTGTSTGTQRGATTGSNIGATTNQGNVTGTNISQNVGTNVGSQVGSQVGTSAGTVGTSGTSIGSTGTTNTGMQKGVMGSDTTNTTEGQQNTSGTSNQVGSGSSAQSQQGTSSQNSLASGFADIINREINRGNTNANSTAIAAGNTPQQQVQNGGGGCYISSIYAINGLIHPLAIRRAACFKLYKRRDRFMPIGYSVVGPRVALYMFRHDRLRNALLAPTRAVLYEELRLSGIKTPFNLSAWLWHGLFHVTTSCLGWVGSKFGRRCETRNAFIKQLLIDHNLYFEV